MKTFINVNSRFIAFSLLGLYLLMISVGLALETAAGSYFAGTEPLAVVVEVTVMTVWVAVGALLVSRRPKHPVGWIWLIIPIIVAVDHLTWGYAYYGTFTNPGALPAVEIPIVWNYWNGRTLGIIPLTLLFLLFPTGRPLSPRWGWLAWIAIGVVAIHIPLVALAPIPIAYLPFPLDILGASESVKAFVEPFSWITGILPVLCALLASFSLILRLHRSRGVERQQLKWFVYAAAFFLPGTFLIIISGIQQTFAQSLLFNIGVSVTLVSITGMAVASAIAILRYRLWDIDIIIRRTLIYGTLTGLLVLLYFGVVTLLQNLVSALSGQESPAAIVLSTLLIAALFSPLRNRIQTIIDRRFYRRKYDAELILAEFALSSRDRVNQDELAESLLRVIDDTLQPKSASLWLKSQVPQKN